VLKFLRRHQLLTSAIQRHIILRESAQKLEISLSQAKKLLNRPRQIEDNPNCLFYHRLRPPTIRLPQDVRDKVLALKMDKRERSTPLIADLVCYETGITGHPQGEHMSTVEGAVPF